MNLANINEIDVSSRQRKFFDEGKIIDLAENIRELELLHAPAVLAAEGKLTLVAGERRLRAIQLLHRKGTTFTYQGEIVPFGCVPVSVVSSATDIAVKELELSENLLREDLTWQEKVQAERELHLLRTGQDPTHTHRDTVKEIKGAEPATQEILRLKEDLFLAERLGDPDISKIKNKKDALRVAKEKALSEKRKAMAEEFKISERKSESPHTLIHGDMATALSTIEPFDLLLTDPPYGVDAGGFNDQFTIKHNYEDAPEEWEELMDSLARLSFERSKDLAHAFVFHQITSWPQLEEIFNRNGWTVWPRPLIWDKGSLGSLPKPNHGPRYCYEAILFAMKGNKTVLRTGRDVITIPTTSKTFHAAEKPTDLYVELIERTCQPGSVVVDPFCGSGTIFPAATRAAVRGIGIEKSEEHYNTALGRMRERA